MSDKPHFYYESDGETSARTHYIIAEDNSDANGGKRLDCTSRKQARSVLDRLKSGELTMEGASAEVGEKWL